MSTKLNKILSLRDLYFASLNGVIGAGWLFGAYYTAQVAGPAAMLSWIIGGIFILILAMNWVEISSAIPKAGGVGRYMKYTHGGIAGAIVLWCALLARAIVPTIVAVAIISIFQTLLGLAGYKILLVNSQGLPTLLGVIVSLGITILFFGINYLGVRIVALTNYIIGIMKILMVPAVILTLIGGGLLLGLSKNFNLPSFMPYGLVPIFTALPTTGIIFAYTGLRKAIDMAGEARTPKKDLWKAVLGVVVTTIIFYTLLQVAFIFSFQWNNAAAGTLGLQPGNWAALNSSLPMATLPLFYEVVGVGASIIAILMAFVAIVGLFADANQHYTSATRVMFGASKEGYFSEKLTVLHSKFRVPQIGIVLEFVITAFLLVLGYIGALVSTIGGIWTAIFSIFSSVVIFSYIAAPAAIPVINKSYKELVKPFSTPLSGLSTLIAFVSIPLVVYWGAGALFTSANPLGGYLLILVMLFGGVLYANYQKKNIAADIKSGAWMVFLLLFILFMLLIGEYQLKLVIFPYSWVIIIVVGILFYLWAIRSALPANTIKNEIKNSINQIE